MTEIKPNVKPLTGLNAATPTNGTHQNGDTPHVNGTGPSLAELLAKVAASTVPPLPAEADKQSMKRSFSDLRNSLDKKAAELPEIFILECIESDEIGFARMFCKIAKGEVVYDRATGSAYFWNNLHWQEDRGGNIYSLAGEVLSGVIRRIAVKKYNELLALQASIGEKKPTESEKEELSQLREDMKNAEYLAKALCKLNYLRNMLVFAGASELLGVNGDEWDTQINLLGVNNAVIDLTTGQPVKPEPSQYIRTVAPVDYDPKAPCPTWIKTITEIFAGNAALVGYSQRFFGYGTSGTCYESDFPVWHGKHGRNGKELILNIIRATLGSKLAGPVEAELLLKSKSDKAKNGATPALMALQGRRIAWASETNEGRTIDNAAMKDLSGGHILTGRHLHKGQVEWKRTHTLILLTNHRPHVGGGGSGAEWERIKLIPFTESFVSDPDPANPHEHKKDPTLADKIIANELPGVLNWLIAGCLEWRKNGLQPPPEVEAATEQYKTDEDTLGRFIDECCVINVDVRAESGALYDQYKQWCVSNGDSPMGSKTFSQKIEDRGYRRLKSGSFRGFTGIGLLTTRISFQ